MKTNRKNSHSHLRPAVMSTVNTTKTTKVRTIAITLHLIQGCCSYMDEKQSHCLHFKSKEPSIFENLHTFKHIFVSCSILSARVSILLIHSSISDPQSIMIVECLTFQAMPVKHQKKKNQDCIQSTQNTIAFSHSVNRGFVIVANIVKWPYATLTIQQNWLAVTS